MAYRPISLSESVVPELDKRLLDNDFHIEYNKKDKKLHIVKSNTTLTDLIETPIPEINTDDNIQEISNNNKNTKYDWSKILMKKFLLFFTHLLLISLFEIMFFNYFIASYEDSALTKLIASITQNINNGCNNFTNQEKEVLAYFINSLINLNSLSNSSQIALDQRIVYNKKLFNLGWYYLAGIAFLNLILIGLNLYYKKTNLYKILFDNFIMITLLGLYEYLFFSTIVLQYENMSTPEIENTFFTKINSCYT